MISDLINELLRIGYAMGGLKRQMEEKGIEACPFCKSSKVGIDGNAAWAVYCVDCGANGPVEVSCSMAVKKWGEACR